MATPNQFLKLRDSSKPTEARTQDNIAATVTPIATRLNATPIMGAPAPAWIRPDLVGGYSQTAAPQPVVAYHKDALGYVHVKVGMTHAAGCAAGTTAFLFGAGYRPSETLTLTGVDAVGLLVAMTLTAAGVFANLAVLAAGDQIRLYDTFLAEQ